jgi:hypothetical protein
MAQCLVKEQRLVIFYLLYNDESRDSIPVQRHFHGLSSLLQSIVPSNMVYQHGR